MNVNTVYQTVLSILNKEQRGYLTPFEFNTIATQVQLEVFEKYFEDLNMQLRIPQNDSEYVDRVKTIEEKIDKFRTSKDVTVAVVQGFGVTDFSALSPSVHRFGSIEFKDRSLIPVTIEKITSHELLLARRSQFTAPTSKFPQCSIEGTKIKILPALATSAFGGQEKTYTLEYVKKPDAPVWGFTVGNLGQYIYNAGSSTNFEISDLDQAEVVLRILAYAGLVVRDPEITQSAAGAAAMIDQSQQQ